MIKYKTYVDLICKTFKFENGLNTLIPFDYEKGDNLLSEMTSYFSNESIKKQNDSEFYTLLSPEDFDELKNNIISENNNSNKSIIIIINGLSTNFMFMSSAQKLDLRIKLTQLIKQFKNMHVMFFTDDYNFISHTRSVLIDNSHIIRTFKSYDAYYRFILKGAFDDVVIDNCEVCI